MVKLSWSGWTVIRSGLFALLLLTAGTAFALDPLVDNGCPDQNGIQQANCSKLGHGGESITVQATECGYSTTCPTASAEVCRSVTNTGTIDYFVPWKKPEEWGAFLSQITPMSPLLAGATPLPINNLAVSRLPGVSVGACCTDETIPQICPSHPCTPTTPGYPHCGYLSSIGRSDYLGVRKVGTRTGLLTHYGAQGDVMGPTPAADIYGDASINYRVTYSCHNGAWIKSYEDGSCTPMAGACAALSDPLPNGWTPPTNMNDLCMTGSTLLAGSFVDNGSSYSWLCEGTPGQPVSPSCVHNKYVAPTAYNGVCGTAQNARLPSPPATNIEKCASGDIGIVTGNGTQGSPWVWSCSGGNGGSSQACKAYLQGSPLDGICGAANGYVATNVGWTPTAAQLCTRTYSPATPVKTGNILDWICTGESGGVDTPCAATLKTVNGTCGVSNSYVVTTLPHAIPTAADLPPGACASGTPTSIAYNSGTHILSWVCTGANGGTNGACSAVVDTSLIKGKCKWSNGAVLSSIPAATSAALCASGTADSVVTSGAIPTVTINWNCLGNQAGYDAACNVVVHIRTDAACGTASGKVLNAKPTAPDLCSVGNASPVTGAANGPIWGWTCGGIYGGTTAYCGAIYNAAPGGGGVPIGGVCNAANMTPQPVKPTTPLCDAGTPTVVSGSGPWSWQCQGLNGGSTASCAAPLLGAGYCGTTHGTRIPNQPNTNLCATGIAGAVHGDNHDGWDWSCTGTSTVQCHADPCDVCTGDLVAMTRNDMVTDQTINFGSGTCLVKGNVDWQEVDTLSPSNVTYTLGLTNSGTGLTYSKSELPVASPVNYCAPCYRIPKSFSGGNFHVQRVSAGVCITGTALDVSPHQEDIPVTGFDVH